MGLSALEAWAPDTNMIITFNIIYPKDARPVTDISEYNMLTFIDHEIVE